jgi:hypothetical protein
MPRVKLGFDHSRRPAVGKFVERLIDEIKSDREFGQPFIYEQQFSTGKIRVLVVWDEWRNLSLEERTSTILAAYEQAEGKDYRAKIALASGLTVPEAHAAGMLPYHVFPALRKSDSLTLEECREAMFAEGATKLMGPKILQLHFATEEEAEASRKRLIARLPRSEEIWTITKEFTAQDFATADDFAESGAE